MANQAPQQCPRCGNVAENFMAVEAGTRLALQEVGETNIPEAVCTNCFAQLSATVSQGLKLRMEQELREKNKAVVWKNRVHLIKNARNMMSQRAYSEAAVQYEKYLRVLEVVYNLKKGQLTPTVFNNSTRSRELTVIASVYWDLMRIYDTNPRYGDRMQKAASQLVEFLRFSPMYPDIVKKAEQFARTAKNPAIVRNFLRQVKSSRGPCFVATAAFVDEPYALELSELRQFRDQYLRPRPIGRRLIWLYYRVSPPLAAHLSRHPRLARAVRNVLKFGLAKLR